MMTENSLCFSSKSSENKAMTWLIFPVALAVFTFGSPSHAFEVDGFSSGMSVREALTIARQHDARAKPITHHDSELTFIHFGEKGNTSKEWKLIFCNDGLVDLTKGYPFSLPAATEIISHLNEQYGAGTVVHTQKDDGSDRSFYGIDFSWEDELDSLLLSMSSFRYRRPEGMAEQAIKWRMEEKIREWYQLKKSCLLEK